MFWVEGFWATGFWADGFWTEAEAPGETAPSDLAVSVLDGVATLTWTDGVTDNTGYAIERKDGDGEWAEIEDDAGDVETYEDTGPLDAEIIYTYRVKVLGGALAGEYSNEASTGGILLRYGVGSRPGHGSKRRPAPRPLIRPRRGRR